ncbi:Ig-like domain-containing protein [Clostridium psychrophilum]|uniref:Ig-like domain-containing protein n=1 Tax=Clostridium psychrophilum TaxID=132926 RepID=UPI001C0E8A32|nr:Ig-like domain-containing protein [Clostridium psychrophilum]MBU3181839.1 Ig-like domain-containing protein [Clostridium psychrophilum]
MRKRQGNHIICFIFAFLLLFMNMQVFAHTVVGVSAVKRVSKVSINKTTDTLIVGQTDTIRAKFTPANATNRAVKWTSSDNTVATINIWGKVTSLKAGIVTITGITVDKGLKISCKVTVKPIPVVSVRINKTTDTLIVGQNDTIKAKFTPANTPNRAVKWTSSDTRVATVDIWGKVTSLKSGTTNITGITVEKKLKVSCKVIVKTIPVVSVRINKTTDALTVWQTDTIKATFSPANATNRGVKWTSTDTTIAAVDIWGKVTSLKPGTVTITGITVDGSKTLKCLVTVTNANIKGIDVSQWQGTINWKLVKSDGVKFAMLRSSYGDGTSKYTNNGVDTMFKTNYAKAKANGIAVGAYHYSYATTVTQATKEANFLIKELKGKRFDYPISVDLENSCQGALGMKKLTSIALTYMNILKHAGYYPMIYTDKYWFTSFLDDKMLASYDHWLAQYGTSITYTGTVRMWQYTSTGTVKGINRKVDMDISLVDYATQIRLLHLNGF